MSESQFEWDEGKAKQNKEKHVYWLWPIRSVEEKRALSALGGPLGAKERRPMKKAILKSTMAESDNMRSEYDFRGAVRGKHYKPLHKGYTVLIHKADGTTVEKHYVLADGAVMLQPEVREYFPDRHAAPIANS